MKRIHARLVRLTGWLSFERVLIFGQMIYGAHVLTFRSFQLSAPWASLVAFTSRAHLSPELLFSALLFDGAAMGAYGLARRSSALRMWGAGCGFTAFFIAFVSQVLSVPRGTGVPAYGFLSLLYLVVVLRQASRTEWVSIRL